LPHELLHALFRRHGSLSAEVLGDAREIADLGRDFGGGLYEREACYFLGKEWAVEAEDMLWRRSKAGLHMNESERRDFAAWLKST